MNRERKVNSRLKFNRQFSEYKTFLWNIDFVSAIARRVRTDGSRARGSGRRGKSANRVLFFGTVCAILAFTVLGTILPKNPPPAEAVSLETEPDPVVVDQSLILAPDSGNLGSGPLVQRALSLADHPDVNVQMEHLLTDKREEILASLALSTRYLSHMVPILEKNELPPELAYLCLIESGYHQSARSHAGAVGMWQMIRSTSRRFELRTDSWIDQRLDFIKSTEGAARFFKYLQERFDDWDHVLAAYNAGEGRVNSAVRRARKAGLDPEMDNLRLPRETRIYVPAFYAALLIAMEPERYGLFPEYEPPLDYIEVEVPGGVPLSRVARLLECGIEELKELNPAIIRGRIPVSGEKYSLRVPCTVGEGKAREVASSLNEIRYVSYRVRKGDTLWDISRKFGVSISKISRSGRSRNHPSRIYPGETLLVALTGGEAI